MELSKLKISFLAGTLGQGGAERQLFFILRALQQSGADVRLLCLTQSEFWEERIKQLGVPITWVGKPKSKLCRLFRIMAELRKDPPAVFQSQHFYTSAYVGAAARLLSLVGIGAMRSDGLSEVRGNGPIGGWLSLRAPQVIAANSQPAILYATRYGIRPKRLYFLPNVVDTEHFKPAARGVADPVRLVSVGSLHERKRFDRFLSVLARLRKETCRDIKGTIVGGGPLTDALQRQAGALGLLPSAVEFRGSLADVAPVYRGSDISVLTSDYEGTPNVLLEAMASGLPVVATKVGGVPEIIQQGKNGFVVEPGNETALFEALARLIKDYQLRRQMGNEARAYVEVNHSIDCLPAKLIGLYDVALS